MMDNGATRQVPRRAIVRTMDLEGSDVINRIGFPELLHGQPRMPSSLISSR